jgi:RNA polymerase sigma factor (sigma-70 family)
MAIYSKTTMSDWELLQDYWRNGSEEAFAALVNRHLDLIYSAALRQVRSPEMAQDVTQSVFADLARSARCLKPNTVLPAWLYEVTRRTAIDLIRKESRRQSREQRVLEMTDMNPSSSDWTNIEPLLDEAMESLRPTDRAALLLRYFQNKSLREVGQSLGLSEDGAQKRVSRATERLRHFLSKRGVTVGISGLILALAANSIQSAPAGLSSLVCSASIISAAAMEHATTLGLTKAIAMTTIQKFSIGAILVAALGTGIYEAQRASRFQARSLELEQKQAPFTEEVRQLRQAQGQATGKLEQTQQELEQLRRETAELPKLRGQLARLQHDSMELAKLKGVGNGTNSDSAELTAASWLARADQLRQALQRSPEKSIPEIQLLTQQDWLDAAKDKLETDEDYRKAMGHLRNAAEDKVAGLVQPALEQYLKANDGKFPTDLSQLQDYLKTPLDPAILQRFGIFPSGAVPNVGMGGDWIITQKTFVDPDYDTHFVIGPNGRGTTSYKQTPLDALMPALQAFSAANGGQTPTDPSQLQPYVSTPDQQRALQNWRQSSATSITH